jgi:hypothetical protein
MEFMGIQYVVKDHLFGIKGAFFLFHMCIGGRIGLVLGRLVMLCYRHRRQAKGKYAENRYQQGFETFTNHNLPEICRKDKVEKPKKSPANV